MCWILVCCGMASCAGFDMKGLIASGSADVEERFREAAYWNDSHQPIVLRAPSDEYCFYVCGDIHIEKAVDYLSVFLQDAQQDEKSCFSVILGDFVTGKMSFPLVAGALSEFRSSVESPDTLFATVGNHDLMFGQWEEYRLCLGVSSYFFEVETPGSADLFISLDSGSGSLGTGQLKWLSYLLSSRRAFYRHVIIFTHINLFKTGNAQTSSGNLPEEEVYALTELCGRYGVELFLQGHDHVRGELQFKGVGYVVVDGLKEGALRPSYCVVTSGEKVSWRFVDCRL